MSLFLLSFIYSMCLFFIIVLMSPWLFIQLFIRKRYRNHLFHRLGFFRYGSKIKNPPISSIWVHGSSVGEMTTAAPLVRKIHETFSELPIVISTMTDTGFAIAEKMFPFAYSIIQFPLDFRFIMHRSIKFWNPRAIIILETEIWPNLFFSAAKHDIPIIIVNGRISDRAFPRYRLFRFFFRHVLRCAAWFSMQSREDAERIAKLGVPPQIISVSGNLKFDISIPQSGFTDNPFEKLWQNLLVITAGSTHEGEEKILLDAFSTMKPEVPNLTLILAPRHPERTSSIEKLIQTYSLSCTRWTRLMESPRQIPDIVIVDTLGELLKFYRICHIAFVGGSLVPVGGHNVLEPAAFGKAIVFGSHIQNFKEATALLLKNSAAIQIKTPEDVVSTLTRLVTSPELRLSLGENALSTLESNRGAVPENISIIRKILRPIPSGKQPSEGSANLHAHFRYNDADSFKFANSFLMRVVLAPFSALYSAVVSTRNTLYQLGYLQVYTCNAMVISIGNLTVGGTGKTPLTIHLVETIQKWGIQPAILTRGYKGKKNVIPLRVTPESSYRDCGDEPLLMARLLPGTPVIVSKNRYDGARWAIREFGSDCLILDDGYQHRKLHRDVNILLIDARTDIFKEHLLPLGRLREPVSEIKRAHIIIFSHTETRKPPEEILYNTRELNPTASIFFGRHQPVGVRPAGNIHAPSVKINGKKVGMLTGIATPLSFEQTIEDFGGEIVWKRSYPDHHPFTEREVLNAWKHVKSQGGEYLVITAKDEMRIPKRVLDGEVSLLVGDVRFVVEDKAQFEKTLKSMLNV